MLTIVTPSLVTLLNVDYDVSVIIDITEEEEKEGKESSKDKDVKILNNFNNDIYPTIEILTFTLKYYNKKYTSNYLDLTSPPPELI